MTIEEIRKLEVQYFLIDNLDFLKDCDCITFVQSIYGKNYISDETIVEIYNKITLK